MKMLHIFHKKTSGKLATDRLKILLISDRLNCSPEMLERIKLDITKVISKYMQIDTQSMEIQITRAAAKGRSRKSPVLYANIPILELKH